MTGSAEDDEIDLGRSGDIIVATAGDDLVNKLDRGNATYNGVRAATNAPAGQMAPM